MLQNPTQTLQDRMTPTHLLEQEAPQDSVPSDAMLLDQVKEAAFPEKPRLDPVKPDLRAEKDYTFNLE